MIKLIVERSISRGAGKYMAQLIADSSDELAGVTEIDDIELDFGSIALTADGKIMFLDSTGTWRDLAGDTEVNGNE